MIKESMEFDALFFCQWLVFSAVGSGRVCRGNFWSPVTVMGVVGKLER